MSEFRQNTGIPIAQYSKEGNFIKNFQSAAKAARELGIKSPSCITECCRGKRKTIGGFIFKYKSE